MKLSILMTVLAAFLATASLTATPVMAQNNAVGGLRAEQPRDMRAMVAQLMAVQRNTVPGLADLAARPGTEDLEDTTITCNNNTHICTCVSDENGDCEAKLAILCEDAHGFGSNGGVGTDCPDAG